MSIWKSFSYHIHCHLLFVILSIYFDLFGLVLSWLNFGLCLMRHHSTAMHLHHKLFIKIFCTRSLWHQPIRNEYFHQSVGVYYSYSYICTQNTITHQLIIIFGWPDLCFGWFTERKYEAATRTIAHRTTHSPNQQTKIHSSGNDDEFHPQYCDTIRHFTLARISRFSSSPFALLFFVFFDVYENRRPKYQAK